MRFDFARGAQLAAVAVIAGAVSYGVLAIPIYVLRGHYPPHMVWLLPAAALVYWAHRRFLQLPRLIMLVIGAVAAVAVVGYVDERMLGTEEVHTESAVVAACKRNLEDLGHAIKLYRAEGTGENPPALAELVPKYLKELPQCPPPELNEEMLPAGTRRYVYEAGQEGYTIACVGGTHSGQTKLGFPQYTSTAGVVDR